MHDPRRVTPRAKVREGTQRGGAATTMLVLVLVLVLVLE
jgi:hypothetical protein